MKANLYIVHELAAEELAATIRFLESQQIFKAIHTVHSSRLSDLVQKEEHQQSDLFLTLHLDLRMEIQTHKQISQLLEKHHAQQLNPYNAFAEIMDDKFAFYNLMLANAFKQAKTSLLRADEYPSLKQDGKLQDNLNQQLEFFKAKNINKVILKPKCGTENIGVRCFDLNQVLSNKNEYDALLEQLLKIFSYDDCLLQEYLKHGNEYRVVILKHSKQKLYLSTQALNSELKQYLDDLSDLFQDYPENRILALDILELNKKEYVLLEVNHRPAALYRAVHKIISLE